MKRRDVHVMTQRESAGWKVMQGHRTLSNHRMQRTAIAAGRRLARRNCVELVTHGRNGRIRSKDSFGYESPRRSAVLARLERVYVGEILGAGSRALIANEGVPAKK